MKKILIYPIVFFFYINNLFACNFTELGKQIPNNFKQNCFEFIGKISINSSNCNGYQTFKIKSNKKIDTFISNNLIIPFKPYKNYGEKIDYKIKNLDGNLDYLKDNNYKTFLIYDEEKNTNPIEIEFENILTAGNFKFIFDYKANYRNAKIKISKDGKNYYPIDIKNISNYSFKYLKISFLTTVRHLTPPEKIKIYELNFISNNYLYIVNTKGDITAYSNNICKNYYPNLTNTNGDFNIDKNTPTLILKLEKNTNLNPNKIEDSDNDGIINKEDNCPNIYNPMQKDQNGDGIGDLCADDDKDGILGYKDNCIYIYNPDQKDINNNNIGDVCEFDKDKDGIFDSQDNCITIPNPNQKDTDKDGIGDACDNCKYYNPRQIDKNNNGIGDICEEKEKFLKEHDQDKDNIIDFKDNCIYIYNPDQKDTDKDGIGDACDNCPNIDNPKQLDKNNNGIGDMCEDIDKDGFIGYLDNCPYIANPKQKDNDNDGIGNVCEDKDGDKIPAINDNCPFEYNPNQKDTDKDGIGDVCDKNDDRFIESNKNIFIGLLILIALIFSFAIFKMIKKLK